MIAMSKSSEHKYQVTPQEFNDLLASHIYLQRLILEGKCDSVLQSMAERTHFFGEEILKAVKERIKEIEKSGDLPY